MINCCKPTKTDCDSNLLIFFCVVFSCEGFGITPVFQLTEPSHLLCSHPATGIAQQKGLQFWGEIWDENQIKFSMSTGFSPPESSSLSISSSSQMVSSTEQPMGERAAAMTTVVEHQGNASRSHSRQSSRESSRSSSERKGVKKSNINRKGKPKVLTVSTQSAHPASPNVGVVANCTGFRQCLCWFSTWFS